MNFRTPFGDPEAFAAAKPYPAIVVDDAYSDVEKLREVAAAFPAANDPRWHHFDAPYEHHKAQIDGLDAYDIDGPGDVLAEMATPDFCAALSDLTGIADLIPNSTGGGLHMTTHGGYLGLHTDSSSDFDNLGLYRRLNVLLFLNRRWRPGDGGELVLGVAGQEGGAMIPPGWNRLAIFRTAHDTLHGHPRPWESPYPRRSLAMYFYTEEPPPDFAGDRRTEFVEGGAS